MLNQYYTNLTGKLLQGSLLLQPDFVTRGPAKEKLFIKLRYTSRNIKFQR